MAVGVCVCVCVVVQRVCLIPVILQSPTNDGLACQRQCKSPLLYMRRINTERNARENNNVFLCRF